MINITNECNLELMARYQDKYFDLAIEKTFKTLIISGIIRIFKEQNRLVRQHQTVFNNHIKTDLI